MRRRAIRPTGYGSHVRTQSVIVSMKWMGVLNECRIAVGSGCSGADDPSSKDRIERLAQDNVGGAA